jgi:hypothetical protein
MGIETERFKAKSDSGEIYTVLKFQKQINAGSLDNPKPKLIPRFVTTSGVMLNQIDAETFQIVATNELVRKLG